MNWVEIKKERIETGNNLFIDVCLKKSPTHEEYIAISKGYKSKNEKDIYKTNILIPMRKINNLLDVIEKIALE